MQVGTKLTQKCTSKVSHLALSTLLFLYMDCKRHLEEKKITTTVLYSIKPPDQSKVPILRNTLSFPITTVNIFVYLSNFVLYAYLPCLLGADSAFLKQTLLFNTTNFQQSDLHLSCLIYQHHSKNLPVFVNITL